MNDLSIDLSKPKYYRLFGDGNLLARFSKTPGGSIRILRVTMGEGKFTLADREPWDFDYEIIHDPRWKKIEIGEFYSVVSSCMKEMQLIVDYKAEVPY